MIIVYIVEIVLKYTGHIIKYQKKGYNCNPPEQEVFSTRSNRWVSEFIIVLRPTPFNNSAIDSSKDCPFGEAGIYLVSVGFRADEKPSGLGLDR